MDENHYAETFGLAFRELLARGDQTRIATALGRSTSLVNEWANGKREPDPRTVILLEELLEVEPGTLTAHLGYMPPEAGQVALTSVEGAIIADDELAGDDKQLLLGMVKRMRRGSR